MLWIVSILVITSLVNGSSTERSLAPLTENARRTLYTSTYSKYEGDIYLAAMFSIHHATENRTCGRIIDQDGLQVITAAVYGLELVKRDLNLPLKIGLLAIDTCQDPDYGLSQSKDFMLFRSCKTDLTYICSDKRPPKVREEYKNLQRIIGVFGAGNSDVSMLAATFLRLVDLPQISYFSTSPELSDSIKFPGFFRTIPSDNYTVRAIAALLRRYKWSFIMIVNDDSKYSTSTKESFTSYVEKSNKYNRTLCISGTITISQDKSKKSIADAVNDIKNKANDKHAPKVVVTFLTQAVIEDLLSYIEINPSEVFGKLIWIGTDSWGGRQWPNVTANNLVMNNSVSVIPKASRMDEFVDYYKKRLPSVDDYNPWLAEKFEKVCGCQYTNKSLFIYPELAKLRLQTASPISCETIEVTCSNKVYQDVLQMPYIHYVMDGILAYANVIKNLIGTNCVGLNASDCADLIWQSSLLGYSNITKELKKVQFKDSTNETFKFWKEREGIPHYSILFFNKSTEEWDTIGSLINYEESRQRFKFTIDPIFEIYLRTNINIPPCSEPCKKGFSRTSSPIVCCWDCEECTGRTIVVRLTNTTDKCETCPNGTFANDDRNECTKYKLKFMSLDDVGAMIIFLADTFGLLFCCFTFVIMTSYWNTPIIKAFGRETSTIILFGTILSFAFSMSLLGMPNRFRCYMYWFTPPFCNTICYASILTKTNRIVRIFGMNWSSKKKANPMFISPMSQIGIICLISFIETCLIITIIALAGVEAYEDKTPSTLQLLCSKMSAGNLVSIFLIPILLLLASTFYAFKMRKTPDGFNETRNINFMNFANCVVLVTSLFLYVLLQEFDTVYPLCLQMTLSAYGNLVGLFVPKVYLVLCRPEKNTIESVSARSRTRSQMSNSQSHTPVSDINLNSNHGNIRCRKCNTIILDPINSEAGTSYISSKERSKEQPKVLFVGENVAEGRDNDKGKHPSDKEGNPNQTFDDDF